VNVRKIWDGRANLEEIESNNATTHFQSLTLFLYNPASHQWIQTLANIDDGTLGQPLIGEFKNGRGEFFNRELFKWNLSSAEHAGAAVIAGDATDATLMNKVVREEAPDVLILN
jgi:hypothetical protein